MSGGGTADVAFRAQQLLEQSLLGELRAVVARALSGLEMFSGQLSELISGEVMAQPAAQVRTGPPAHHMDVVCSSVLRFGCVPRKQCTRAAPLPTGPSRRICFVCCRS